jgi:hypothetical protein
MAFESFRAGSGSYQNVRVLQLNPSSVPQNNTSVETFSAAAGNLASGTSIADLDEDSLYEADWAAPQSFNGLIIIKAEVIDAGVLQLTMMNVTGSTIAPAAGTQIDLLQF